MQRLVRKLDTAAGLVPEACLRKADVPTKSAIVSFGSCDAAVGEAVDRLSEEHRSVLEPYYLRGVDIRELASEQSETVDAIKSRLKRAR